MSNKQVQASGTGPAAVSDVFAAARWFDKVWNSTGKAVSPQQIEWQCRTWGSGRGGADWVETATFTVVAVAFGFDSWRNDEARDELVVLVPLKRFPEVAQVIERLGDIAEDWPWLFEDDRDDQIQAAAEILEMPATAIAENVDLLQALRIM